MSRLRTMLWLAVAGIAFAASLGLLARVVGWTSPWIALLLMFDLMGMARIAEPLFVLSMPAALVAPRPWERSGSAGRWLAVDRFGTLLRDTPLRHFNPGVYRAQDARDLRTLHRRLASAEATHFWAAVAWTFYVAALLIDGHRGFATGFLIVQLLFNVYPILHLRSVRRRVEALLHRRMRRWSSTDAAVVAGS